MSLAPNVIAGDPESVRQAIAKLATKLGTNADVTHASVILTDLTASRILSTNTSKSLTSVSNLASWVAGVANETDVTDDGDGTITIGIVNPLIVGKGGTGLATITDHALLLGSGTDAVTPLVAATNGQIPIGSTGADPTLAALTEGEGIDVTNAAGSITIALNINGLAADATPDGTVDYVVTWDASVATHKKVLLNNLPGGGGGATTFLQLTDTPNSYAPGDVGKLVRVKSDLTGLEFVDSPKVVDIQITGQAYFDAEVDNGNSGAADTVDWTLGNKQKSTLTASCTYTFTAPTGPCNLILRCIQDAGGPWVGTWPATVKWPGGTKPTLSAANKTDIIAFYFDGTNYWGNFSLNLS